MWDCLLLFLFSKPIVLWCLLQFLLAICSEAFILWSLSSSVISRHITIEDVIFKLIVECNF